LGRRKEEGDVYRRKKLKRRGNALALNESAEPSTWGAHAMYGILELE